MYLFLLGRDKELSKLELAVCLDKNKCGYAVVVECGSCLILDIDKNKEQVLEMTKELSGTVRLGRIYHKSKKLDSEITSKLDFDFPRKFNYTISSFGLSDSEIFEIEGVLKKAVKQERCKAVYKKPVSHCKGKKGSKDKNHIANPDNYMSWSLTAGLELFVVKQDGCFFFSRTLYCSNPREFAFLDKNRPEIKEKYNTSFRLASILTNLLGLEKSKTIADPFCGTGTFLIEGLLKGYNVIGIDKDQEMIKSAEKNVRWAVNHFKLQNSFKLICGDSAKTRFSADACVFEPYMGPFLKKQPSFSNCKELVSELNRIYFAVFSNLDKCLPTSAKVVCILPEFKASNSKVVSIDNRVFLDNGFAYVDVLKFDKGLGLKNKINYSTPDGSFIGRTINLLEKTR